MFMARAVRQGRPIGNCGDKPFVRGMPELLPLAREAYERVFPDRLDRFPCDDGHTVTIGDTSDVVWHHELWHDAESAFWLLVWWTVTAYPEDSSMTQLPASLWTSFTDTLLDTRPCTFSSEAVHNGYLPLHELLTQVGNAVAHDFHWATQKPYNDPEFLHEAFQRHILNFIFDHREERFMLLRKADNLRKPSSPTTQTPAFSTLKIGSKRARDIEEPEPVS